MGDVIEFKCRRNKAVEALENSIRELLRSIDQPHKIDLVLDTFRIIKSMPTFSVTADFRGMDEDDAQKISDKIKRAVQDYQRQVQQSHLQAFADAINDMCRCD